jgi:hypothetical protein
MSKQLIDAFSRLLDDLDRREADRNNRATTHLAEVRAVVQGLCNHEWPENWSSTNYAFCKHCGKAKAATPDKAVARAAGDDEAWALISDMATFDDTPRALPHSQWYSFFETARRLVVAAGAAKTGGDR